MSDWYYAKESQQIGPIELPTLQQLVAAGTVGAQDLVWQEGMPEWSPTSKVPALAYLVASGPTQQQGYAPQPAYLQQPAYDPAQGYAQPTYYAPQPMPAYGQSSPGYYAAPGPLGYAQPSGYPLGYAQPVADTKYATLAMTGMVLTLVAFLAGSFLIGIPGGICGLVALRGMKRTGNTKNKGFAITAVAVGGFWTLALVALIVFIVVMVVYSK